MAFAGYLLKVGGTEFPPQYIKEDSYQVTPGQRLDMDSTRDSQGVLHRTVLPHRPAKITLTVPALYDEDVTAMMQFLTARWVVPAQRKCTCEYWDVETGTYKTGYFYMPDIMFTISRIDKGRTKIKYNETTLTFIEY